VELPANDGPGRNRLGWGRDLQTVLLHGLDQGPDGASPCRPPRWAAIRRCRG
jgi:hypothetical protein